MSQKLKGVYLLNRQVRVFEKVITPLITANQNPLTKVRQVSNVIGIALRSEVKQVLIRNTYKNYKIAAKQQIFE